VVTEESTMVIEPRANTKKEAAQENQSFTRARGFGEGQAHG